MARKHLINLHTTGTTLPSVVAPEGLRLGEIAVQHNAEHPELIIATSVENDGTFAHFIDSAATQVLINASVSGVSQDLTTLEGIVGDGFGTAGTITEIVSNLQSGSLSEISASNAEGALVTVTIPAKGLGETTQTVSAAPVTADISGNTEGLVLASDARAEIGAVDAKLGDGVSSASTVTAQLGAITGNVATLQGVVSGYSETGSIKTAVDTAQNTATSALTTASTALQSVSHGTDGSYVTVTVGSKDNNDQAISAALTVQGVSSADADHQGVAEASDVKAYVDGRVSGVSQDVTTIKGQLSGFDTTSGAVKDYVDSAISQSISSVYRVKGTKATYADLPLTGNTKGDVWNVTAATGSTPAGTNYVWVLDAASAETREEGWDALGGTIDLSPYQTVSGFTAYTSTTETTLGAITGNVNTLSSVTGDLQSVLSGYTGVGSVSADVKTAKDAAADALTAVTVSGDDYVTLTAGTKANQAIAISAATTTHAIDTAAADTDGLATAFAVKNYVTGITQPIAQNVTSLSGATTANTEAIDDLEEIVGTGFSQTTLTDKISTLEAGSYEGLVSGACEYITLSLSGVDASTHKETIGVSAVTVAIDDAVAGSNDGLVLASDAKAELGALSQDITGINTKLGGDFSSGKTVASEITRLDDAMLTSISAGTDGTFVTTTVGAKSNKNQTVGVSVTTKDVSAATAQDDGLAVASDVKDYVDDATSGISTMSQDISDLQAVTSGFTTASSIYNAIEAVKTTADGAVQDVAVSGITGVTTSETASTITIDFTEMVIDCGTY